MKIFEVTEASAPGVQSPSMLSRVLSNFGFGKKNLSQNEYQIYADMVGKDLDNAVQEIIKNPNLGPDKLEPSLENWFAKKYGPINPNYMNVFRQSIDSIANSVKADQNLLGKNYQTAKAPYIKSLWNLQTDAEQKLRANKVYGYNTATQQPAPAQPLAPAQQPAPAQVQPQAAPAGRSPEEIEDMKKRGFDPVTGNRIKAAPVRTGGKVKGQLSTDPRAVARRQATAARHAQAAGLNVSYPAQQQATAAPAQKATKRSKRAAAARAVSGAVQPKQPAIKIGKQIIKPNDPRYAQIMKNVPNLSMVQESLDLSDRKYNEWNSLLLELIKNP
jgi:hypothetical protein